MEQKITSLQRYYMRNKTKLFGQVIFDWLNSIAPTYRGVLPAGEKTADLYLQIGGYYDSFAKPFIFPVQIYKKNTTSYLSVVQTADAIGDLVGEGLIIVDDGIRIKIEKGSPFYQDKPDEDETIRAGYVNLEITIY